MNTIPPASQQASQSVRESLWRDTCRVLALLVASLVVVTAATGQSVTIEQQIGKELLAMATADQAARSADVGAMSQQERREHFAAAADGDRQRATRLQEIIDSYGWPDPQRFGEGAGEAAFLIVQHADHDPEFQARCLPLLQQAAEQGHVSLRAVAFLTDRVRVKQGRPQVYGTQYQPARDDSGRTLRAESGRLMYELPLVEDIEWLDERRAAVGLGPWLHYERQMAEQQGREPARAPRSFQSEDENAIHDEAMQVLKRVSRHYGTLPVMTDLIATSFVMEGRKDETSSIQVRLNGESSEAVGIVPPTALDIYLIDGTLFLGLVGAPGMVVAEVDGDPLASAEQHLGIAFAYLPPQLWMRWTDGTERAGEWFTFGMLDESKIKGVSSREIEGRRVYEITFEGIAPLLGGRSGKGVARIDAESLLLAEVVIDGGTDEEVPTFRFEAAFSPLTPVVLETPIEVELSEDAPRYNGFMDMLTTALAAKPTLEVGTIAPPFQLRDQHGNEHSLEDYRGQYVVLDWWGLWCAPCVESLPHIQELHDKYADDDSVSVLLMNVRDDVEKTRAYLREHEYTFTSLDDADGMVEAYGIRAFPSVVLLGPDGIVLHAEAGSSAEVERVLERALAEHKAAVSGP